MAEKKKTEGQLLEEKLLAKNESGFADFMKKNRKEIFAFGEDYKKFLGEVKTEREFTDEAVNMLEAAGFVALKNGKKYKAGDRVYMNNHGKSLIAAIIGKKPIEQGANIVAAHVDNPRLDLKPNPLYEDNELAYFKTHYYGGIKKYQWVTIPLALHGVVIKKGGENVKVNIGEDESDPVFVISDILPHLSAHVQDDRKAREVIKGEELNVIIGSEPYDDSNVKEPVKLNVLRLLNEKYGITEADFVSAELCAVPALKPRDLGLDRSLIGAYGHDDRSCAYVELRAFIDFKGTPERTSICVLADKEEIGSVGSTGLESDMLVHFYSRLSGDVSLAMHNSKCLSCDVNAAIDPTFASAHETRNASRLNHGPVLTKYTGARGKSSTNDAHAEFMSEMRDMLDAAGVPWQTGELGKVDEGGGGTVALYVSHYGVDTVDFGVALLSMHAPWEVASKIDLYSMYKSCLAFYAYKGR